MHVLLNYYDICIHAYISNYLYCIVNIVTPPENITNCRGSDVNISCGYQWASALPVTWIINGTSFDQSAIENSPLYRLNNAATPMRISLTIFSINDNTTVRCIVHYNTNMTTHSTLGTLTVIGTYGMCIYCMYDKSSIFE